jgi:hypothetical protein
MILPPKVKIVKKDQNSIRTSKFDTDKNSSPTHHSSNASLYMIKNTNTGTISLIIYSRPKLNILLAVTVLISLELMLGTIAYALKPITFENSEGILDNTS